MENLNKATITKQQTTQVIDNIYKLEKVEGRQIQEIHVGDLQISKDELSIKEYLLKGNESYYKQDYKDTIKLYDRALEIKPDDELALNNKGLALNNLGKYNKSIEWYDKALEIKPDHEMALNNKRLTQEKLEEDKEKTCIIK
jgi:tetratricopeptide (TPR) repeat protein